MKLGFRTTSPADRGALSEFLRRILQLRAGAALLDEAEMTWKYWRARPDWQDSRSYIAHRGDAIVAHAAVWPLCVRAGDREVAAVHVIDWAADPKCPGAGIWLFRRIAERVPLMLSTRGTAISRNLFPLLGFRPHSALCEFARPVRPLGQALTTRVRNWKLAVKLLRNTLARLSHPLSLPRGWSVSAVVPDSVPERLWPEATTALAVTARNAAFYRYLIDCPGVRHALFELRKNGEPAGYFCLVSVPHAVRIVDLWVPSNDVGDWRAAFQAATVTAADAEDVYEVSVHASTARARDALSRAGFRLCERSPVGLYGDADMLAGRELHLQMIDSDASFASRERVSYYLI